MKTKKMIAYRADDRDYNIGSVITPRNEDFIKLNDNNQELKIKVEQILELFRPKHKPERNKVLMLFTSIERAKNHWSLYSNSNLYQVEIDSRKVIHVGDYNKVESLYKLVQNNFNSDYESLANAYWNELDVVEPELFVAEALVTNILGNNSDRRNVLKVRWGFKPMERDIE